MPSVIDYSICGSNVIDQVHSFSVLPFTGISDHCCISTCITVNIGGEVKGEGNNERLHPINVRYTYDRKHIKRFENYITSDTNLKILDFKLRQNTDPTHDDINEHIKTMNSVILDAAKKMFFY